jgi:hypothetical protein
MQKKLFFSLLLYFYNVGFSQIPNFPTPQTIAPSAAMNTSDFVNRYGNSFRDIATIPSPGNVLLKRQNQNLIQEAQKGINAMIEEQQKKLSSGNEEKEFVQIFRLPSMANKEGAAAYYSAFKSLSKLNPEDYSIADATFFVENAFYYNDKKFQSMYQDYIRKASSIIRNKIKQKNIDDDDNASKNLTLFQYFSTDTRQNGKVLHKAIKYDFDDYWGTEDHSKMFVSKLMRTNTGQCHSMPLLYLILAEQIGAKASLVMSPNHSYIRFTDNDGESLNIELTNGMFTANSFVLNNGYIKSEALQNKLYMQSLNKRELLSQTFVDLASGYVHKFGYDEFVGEILNKAQELNPHNINAVLWESNLNQQRFEKSCERLGINPHHKKELQKISNYKDLIMQLDNINGQFDFIDRSGFAQMPAEQYEKWLGSIQKAENKQLNDEILEKIKAVEAQKRKQQELQKRQKITSKKEAPKVYLIPVLT